LQIASVGCGAIEVSTEEAPGPVAPPPPRPAVFLDRDGTLIEEVHYLSNPARVRVLPGAAGAVRKLRAGGFACVVATNQSAIGRGMITETQLVAIHHEMNRQLAAEGTALDAIYVCPDAPSAADDDPAQVACSDRKPGPGMLLRAARELGLDLAASWSVGDMLRDLQAGHRAGCPGNILVCTGKGRTQVEALAASGLRYHVVANLAAAADLILAQTGARD
jgi:D-glycero-D-manno-heptose 1,7-bisphosphate phosphatase